MAASVDRSEGRGEFMLFGVRLVVDSLRKSVSLNNLSQYEQPQELLKKKEEQEEKSNCGGDGNDRIKDNVAGSVYASADEAAPNSSVRNRERKRGIPWSEKEHKLFLLGLQKAGKGDWRRISRNFVKTRTPTQVASHAQKYFLRHINLNRRCRKSSLFDIITDTVTAIASNSSSLQVSVENPVENLILGQPTQASSSQKNIVPPIPAASEASTPSNLMLNLKPKIDQSPLSLNLSLASDQTFQVMATSFNSGDNNSSVISVA